MDAQLQLKAYADLVDARLDVLLPGLSVPPQALHEAMRYSCLAPGKRLRPALCIGAAIACGARAEDALDAACAVEMVHCFSLIHDDLPAIDDDDLRRGLPTCHKRFGEAIAILAGDALFARAFEVLANVEHPPARVAHAVRVLTRASGSDGLVGGEVIDVLSEGRPVDEGTLQMIHARKTGALVAASCEIGTILAGADDGQARAMAEFGAKVGLAFQIADDILNETADATRLGKSVGSDRLRAKATYVALYGLDRARTLAHEAASAARSALPSPSPFLLELADFAVTRLS